MIDGDGRYAAEARGLRKRHVDGDARCYAGVDGIASVLEDTVAGRSRQIVPR